jgi:ABC-2 type transport system ATP-binding protein
METVIAMEGVTKRFGEHTAVDDFSLRVPQGSIFGFIGPNGSGKTTSLRMMLRIIDPDSGRIEVFGRDRSTTASDHIGYLPEERGLYRKMTVLSQLTYFGILKGLSRRAAKASAAAWLERFGLEAWGGRKLENLSKGMSQKVQLIATIIGEPKLLVLDEPFSGLDPVNLEAIRDVLLELRRGGTTLIFSTHDMATAEQFCDHICMIYRGRKVLDGSMRQIQEKYGQDTVRLRFADGVDLTAVEIAGAAQARERGRFWELQLQGEPSEVLQAANKCGKLEHFEVSHPTLHDIFVRIAKAS